MRIDDIGVIYGGAQVKIAFAVCMLTLAGGVGALLVQPPREVCLGEFTTSLKGRTRNQAHNATLAMSKLRDIVIKPGQVFSFNQSVGTYTVDAGYRKAPVSYNGQLLEGWGGGVCQSSTTVYNAALLAGMEIEDRSHHRYAPLYAPPGRDAAVAYPHIDLKFRNPFPFPVVLRGRWVGERLMAGIYASMREGEAPKLVTQVLDRQDPGVVSLTRRSQTGRTRNTGKAGFEVATYRIIGSKRVMISRDSYPAMMKVVEYVN